MKQFDWGEILQLENSDKNNHIKANDKINAILDAMPLCLTIWNHKMEVVMCNQRIVELFEIQNKETYITRFFEFSPSIQPNGKDTYKTAFEFMNMAREKETVKFNWLHCKLDGEEIPTEVILQKVQNINESGNEIYLGVTQDLRPFLAENRENASDDIFVLNQVSDKALFNIVTDLSSEWFWVYDIKTSMIQFFGKGAEILNLPKEKILFPKEIIAADMVYPEDMDIFMGLSEAIKVEFEHPWDFRFQFPDGSVRYYRVVFKTFCNEAGDPIYSVGKTFDIHAEASLKELSQKDLLTNCYNKITSSVFISDTLERASEENHTLFIVDIDDFKGINDNFGHHFGDKVLTEISAKMNTLFRPSDIIGRLGGDEFIILLKKTKNREVITKKAKAIIEAFQNTYSGEEGDYSISGSVGIAIYPYDGDTYEELYKAADKALYQSKHRGKNVYTFYGDVE